MKMPVLVLSASASAIMSMPANADVSFSFESYTASGGVFAPIVSDGTFVPMTGTLDSIFGDFVLDAEGGDFTYSNDLTILFGNLALNEVYLQIGGFNQYTESDDAYFSWPLGDSDAAGTTGGGTVDSIGVDVTGWYMWIGNGYYFGSSTTWTGDMTLNGSINFENATVVPGSTAIAVLGAFGLARIRRRRA